MIDSRRRNMLFTTTTIAKSIHIPYFRGKILNCHPPSTKMWEYKFCSFDSKSVTLVRPTFSFITCSLGSVLWLEIVDFIIPPSVLVFVRGAGHSSVDVMQTGRHHVRICQSIRKQCIRTSIQLTGFSSVIRLNGPPM